MTRIKRRTESGQDYSADFLELFFDLVFVFAITQVSHLLLDHLTWKGAGQAGLCLLVVWWAWNYTTWVTNELDPEATSVRLLMIGLMLAGLLMAIAIPEAFGDKALLFAGSYVAAQIGRHTFLTFFSAEPGTLERERAGRILIWFLITAPLWIAGALAEGEARTALWVAALVLDYAGPLHLYSVPGMRRLAGSDWDLGTAHFAERFGLFVIIVLGESIILTGVTTAELDLDTKTVVAFGGAFAGTAALWWLYFTRLARHARTILAAAAERVLIARDVYTFGHVLIVAGIVLTAVADEIVIAHPSDELGDAELLAVVAGPALFLLAQALLRYRLTGEQSPRRLAGVAACAVVWLVGGSLSALLVGLLLLAILIGVIVADAVSAARRARPA